VITDGARTKEKLPRNLTVGGAGGRQTDDLKFLGREPANESALVRRTVISPAARSSLRVRSAHGVASERSNVSSAARNCVRASVGRRLHRSHSPYSRWVRAL
jgi:hypothetical protein